MRVRLIALLAVSLGLAACGSQQHPSDATAENNGYYVRAGGVTYQLQISRELNQFSVEDHQYLAGLPPSPPKSTELWYGVFLWAKNNTHHPLKTAALGDFYIIDTEGTKYYPVRLGAANQYAWQPTTLAPLGTEPGPDTTASFGPTQGALVLFKLNTSAYANRPLTLEINAPGEQQPSSISLDL